jgi:DNA-binding response OmpR family regulator
VGVVTASPTPKVLVVDDDAAILKALERALRLEGFAVSVADGGRAALVATAADAPDVIVLDVGLPDLNGRAVAARLRARGDDVPICILSARDEVEERIAGLEAGADDYLVKPFAVEELVARLRALLRRHDGASSRSQSGGPAAPIVVGDLTVDMAGRRALRGEREVDLTPRELELLEVLARNHGVVLSRDRLLDDVWGHPEDAAGNVVDVFVGYLRRKLEADGESRIIHTVRGIGFVLRP